MQGGCAMRKRFSGHITYHAYPLLKKIQALSLKVLSNRQTQDIC